jgi:exonuclease I
LLTAGRPKTWLNEKDFARKYRLLIPQPHTCLCGNNNYRFGKDNTNLINATCNICGAWLRFDPSYKKWDYVIPRIYQNRTFLYQK